MANPRDLAALADVKAFISPPLGNTTASDGVLSALISGVSRSIEAYVGRELMAQSWNEVRNGTGQDKLALKRFPIIGVTSVTVDTTAIPAAGAPPTQSWGGYTFDDRFVYVGSGFLGFPGRFARGMQNVEIAYSAGYITPGMIAVAALPAWTGQTNYVVNAEIVATPAGGTQGYVFTTAAGGTSGASAPAWPAQLGASVTDGSLSWQCSAEAVALFPGAQLLPDGIKVAAMQQVALTFKQRTRVGDSGTGEGPQRVTYMNQALHPTTVAMLDPYRDWAFPGDVF
ncbi:MAG TPA: hypothetical protein VMF62_17460 [Acetobacteraceae bacterium]|jgi:hypothetical protein|nr:hypothetical protein [Acetobacteraceae bacterium]